MSGPIVTAVVSASTWATATAAPAPGAGVGTVISARPIPAGQELGGAARGTLVTYRTTDEYGKPAVSNGQVFVPAGKPPAGGWPVVAWGYGTTGVNPACATTEHIEAGEKPGLAAELSNEAISAFLKRGYAVAATDYIGLGGSSAKHHYLSSKAEGHALIDVVRAARATDPHVGTVWVSAGHSQGGQAALMANRLADTYAPELSMRGTLAFAPESNAENLLQLLFPGLPSPGGVLDGVTSLLLYTLYGLNDSRPDIHALSVLNPRGMALYEKAKTMCITDLRKEVTGVSPGAILNQPLITPTFSMALHDYMGIPTTGWTHPVAIYHGTDDHVVPTYLSVALAGELHFGGSTATLALERGTSHYQVIHEALPAAETALDTMTR
ncbi:prolyl oligopeptidase family serine peptidase [Gordonia jinhuaensis]|uniref:Lipase n=1 Tax=Gordonia jinhuaensis TaxID=1517702 RepID=A0A916TIV3_9ACTN|nr:alpha/beta fold hydrolase [Gordonia jinhuaensis]GGB47223.1 lipase [Gordonia jinhuaensis]